MRVLVACERSGVVREAFIARGHAAWSCDLERSEDESPFHIVGDALKISRMPGWDLMIAHPPCQYLAGSGWHWTKKQPERAGLSLKAANFAVALWNAPIDKVCIENPVGMLSFWWVEPHQTIQPYQFGEDASKRTCLWLRNLPFLKPTGFVEPRIGGGLPLFGGDDSLPRWSNQTDSGQNRLGPSDTRAFERAKTYPGIARAFADQWGRM